MSSIYGLQASMNVQPLCAFSFNDAVNNHSFVIYPDLTYECSPGFDATIGGKIFAQSIMVGSEYLAGIKESSLEREANFYSKIAQRLDEFDDLEQLKTFIRNESLAQALIKG